MTKKGQRAAASAAKSRSSSKGSSGRRSVSRYFDRSQPLPYQDSNKGGDLGNDLVKLPMKTKYKLKRWKNTASLKILSIGSVIDDNGQVTPACYEHESCLEGAVKDFVHRDKLISNKIKKEADWWHGAEYMQQEVDMVDRYKKQVTPSYIALRKWRKQSSEHSAVNIDHVDNGVHSETSQNLDIAAGITTERESRIVGDDNLIALAANIEEGNGADGELEDIQMRLKSQGLLKRATQLPNLQLPSRYVPTGNHGTPLDRWEKRVRSNLFPPMPIKQGEKTAANMYQDWTNSYYTIFQHKENFDCMSIPRRNNSYRRLTDVHLAGKGSSLHGSEHDMNQEREISLSTKESHHYLPQNMAGQTRNRRHSAFMSRLQSWWNTSWFDGFEVQQEQRPNFRRTGQVVVKRKKTGGYTFRFEPTSGKKDQ